MHPPYTQQRPALTVPGPPGGFGARRRILPRHPGIVGLGVSGKRKEEEEDGPGAGHSSTCALHAQSGFGLATVIWLCSEWVCSGLAGVHCM